MKPQMGRRRLSAWTVAKKGRFVGCRHPESKSRPIRGAKEYRIRCTQCQKEFDGMAYLTMKRRTVHD